MAGWWIPQGEFTVGGSLSGYELAAIIGALGVTAAIVIRSVAAAWGSRRALGAERARLDRLEMEVDRLRAVADRVGELEERVEFAERLLPRPDPEGGADPAAEDDPPAIS